MGVNADSISPNATTDTATTAMPTLSARPSYLRVVTSGYDQRLNTWDVVLGQRTSPGDSAGDDGATERSIPLPPPLPSSSSSSAVASSSASGVSVFGEIPESTPHVPFAEVMAPDTTHPPSTVDEQVALIMRSSCVLEVADVATVTASLLCESHFDVAACGAGMQLVRVLVKQST
jgi:hypothetical protein